MKIEILAPERDAKGRFLTGDGNPKGFTTDERRVMALFREKSEDAANVLYDVMMNKINGPDGERMWIGPALRSTVAVHWLNRAFGTPKQTIDMADQGRTLEDILRSIAAAREAERAEKAVSPSNVEGNEPEP